MRKRLLVTLAALTLAVSSLSGCFDDEWDESGFVEGEDYEDDYDDETDEDYVDENDDYSDEDDGYFNFSDDPNEEQEPITQEMEEVYDEEDEEHSDNVYNPAIAEFVGRYRINERSTIEIFDDYTWIYESDSYDQPYEMDGDYMLLISVHTDGVIYKVQVDQNGDLYDFLREETYPRIYD